jgi:hypothetical protein
VTSDASGPVNTITLSTTILPITATAYLTYKISQKVC